MAKPQYGGQAVIEGVMMRGPDGYAVAVRKPDGTIGVVKEDVTAISKRYKALGLPILRGAVIFVDSLLLGVKSLMLSADMSGEENEKLSPAAQVMTMLVAMGFAVGLFIVLPTVLMSFARRSVGAPSILMNIAEGLLRGVIFVLYVVAISRMGEVRRVLAYHGAEHMVINTYDSAEELTVDNARTHSRLHPRCGTSFLLFVVLIGSALFSLFGWPGLLQRIMLRLALLPLVAGLSYEVIRFSGRTRMLLVRLACAPGMWLQRLTTLEPDNDQIEVAIESLKALLASS